jgi:hypothetical protein
VDQAIGYRMNPWLVVALVAAIVLLAAVLVVATQHSLIHSIGGTLQGPRPMAPWGCGGSSTAC